MTFLFRLISNRWRLVPLADHPPLRLHFPAYHHQIVNPMTLMEFWRKLRGPEERNLAAIVLMQMVGKDPIIRVVEHRFGLSVQADLAVKHQVGCHLEATG